MQLILVLDNIRSVYNVGAILRTAEGFGVDKVLFSGITPCPTAKPGQLPHVVEKMQSALHKTALGAEKLVACEYVANLHLALQSLRKMGFVVVGLENNLPGHTIYQLNNPELQRMLGDKVALILGEEVHGIAPELYSDIEYFVEIPMHGQKESFNVGVAAGMAMYALMMAG